MTVPFATRSVEATGNGVAFEFSFSPLVLYENTDLTVTHIDDATGVETLLTEGTGASNYSLNVTSYPGTGSITYPADESTPLAATERVVMKPVYPVTQLTDLVDQGTYFPEVLETQLDKLLQIDLQQQELLDRSILIPIGFDGSVGETDNPIASTYLRRNSTNDGYEHATIATTTGSASDDTPQDVSLSAGAPGAAADYSRSDHAHLLPTVSVAKGGTGGTTAAAARTNLGVAALTDAEKAQHDTAYALTTYFHGGF